MTPPAELSATAQAALDKLTKREQEAVRRSLRAQLRSEVVAELRETRQAARKSRQQETPEVAAAARRMIRAVGKRAAVDLDGLALLAELRQVVDDQLGIAVAGARRGDGLANGDRYSWADVGRVLGTSRQAAQMRFGKAADQ